MRYGTVMKSVVSQRGTKHLLPEVYFIYVTSALNNNPNWTVTKCGSKLDYYEETPVKKLCKRCYGNN